jgi:putative PIN family toxin of toxin-antitoxin system
MRRIRVVLDTNVVVSAHLNAEGYERHVLDLVLAGKLQMAVSEPILAEYEGVLRRPKFAIKPRQVSESIRLLRKAARIVNPHRKLAVTSRSVRQSLPGVRRYVEGRLCGDRQQTPLPQGVAADAGRECARIA